MYRCCVCNHACSGDGLKFVFCNAREYIESRAAPNDEENYVEWYPATVTGKNGNGTWQITYTEDGTEVTATADQVRTVFVNSKGQITGKREFSTSTTKKERSYDMYAGGGGILDGTKGAEADPWKTYGDWAGYGYFIYTALDEETPFQISQKFGVTVKELLGMNRRFGGIDRGSKLQAGTTISVPRREKKPRAGVTPPQICQSPSHTPPTAAQRTTQRTTPPATARRAASGSQRAGQNQSASTGKAPRRTNQHAQRGRESAAPSIVYSHATTTAVAATDATATATDVTATYATATDATATDAAARDATATDATAARARQKPYRKTHRKLDRRARTPSTVSPTHVWGKLPEMPLDLWELVARHLNAHDLARFAATTKACYDIAHAVTSVGSTARTRMKEGSLSLMQCAWTGGDEIDLWLPSATSSGCKAWPHLLFEFAMTLKRGNRSLEKSLPVWARAGDHEDNNNNVLVHTEKRSRKWWGDPSAAGLAQLQTQVGFIARCKPHTVELCGVRDLADAHIPALASVHTLSLANCVAVSDVSSLGNVHTLDLGGCVQVADVAALGKVHTLNLFNCKNVKDVANLGHLHTLDLTGCSQITDVSALANLHTLDVSGDCQNGMPNIVDVSALGNVYSLNLSYCQSLVDVSKLGNVHRLNLYRCKKVVDVSGLTNVHTLNLSGCCDIVDVSALGSSHFLDLSGTNSEPMKVADVSGLTNVHTLDLRWCGKINDVSALGRSHYLNLSYCKNVVDVSALGSVHTLDLSSCAKVADVSALGRVQSLDLRECPKVTDLSALHTVRTLVVDGTKAFAPQHILFSYHIFVYMR